MVLLEGGHDAGPLAVDGLGHQLLAPEVQMQPIGSQTGGQLLIFVDNSGHEKYYDRYVSANLHCNDTPADGAWNLYESVCDSRKEV